MAAPAPGALPPARTEAILAAASLLAAMAWLGFRTLVGLDFTDEMQYYGQISSLVRTGKFFQDDLFIQQLGNLLVYPFFRLHAAVFPDLDFLVLFGRLVLLGGYGFTGILLWRVTGGPGGFSVAARLAGLATLAAWIPFQLFAPSYNTLSYLLMVCLVAVWITRARRGLLANAVATAALLAGLTVAYPPIGIVLSALLVATTAWRQGWRPAGVLLGCIGLAAVITAAGLVGLHGRGLMEDLLTSVQFSRAFSGGQVVQTFRDRVGLLAPMAAAGWFFWRIQRTPPSRLFRDGDRGQWGPYLVLVGLVLVVGALFAWPVVVRTVGYAPIASGGLLLMLLATAIGRAEEPTAGGPDRTARMRRVATMVLAVGGAALLALSVRSPTGYFAISFFLVLLLGLAVMARADERGRLAELAGLGTVAGAVFASSSGNGLHNFGVGAAGVAPFLVLHWARWLEGAAGARLPAVVRHGLLPLLVGLVLFNGLRNPYREQRGMTGFQPVRGVPAFAGLRTSAEKIEALARFRQLHAPGTLKGQRLLVTGPHPWFYFASQGEPATPMLFMHFEDVPQIDEFIARFLFRGGEPDTILITAPLPPPLHARIVRWIEQGCTAKTIRLPPDFKRRYEMQTGYTISEDILLVRRERSKP